MKPKSTRKYKPNSKLTEGKCLRCSIVFKSFRNDARYCSTLCRVQERNYRIENKINNLVSSGSLDELKSFMNRFLNQSIFKGLEDEFEDFIELYLKTNNELGWKYKSKNILVYYFIKKNKKELQLFFDDQLNNKLQVGIRINDVLNPNQFFIIKPKTKK
jgi:hypothetical protein